MIKHKPVKVYALPYIVTVYKYKQKRSYKMINHFFLLWLLLGQDLQTSQNMRSRCNDGICSVYYVECLTYRPQITYKNK